MKTYLPDELYNNSYTYYLLDNNNILIYTDSLNCIIYDPKTYLTTEEKVCTPDSSLYELNINQFIVKDIYNIWNIMPFLIASLILLAFCKLMRG